MSVLAGLWLAVVGSLAVMCGVRVVMGLAKIVDEAMNDIYLPVVVKDYDSRFPARLGAQIEAPLRGYESLLLPGMVCQHAARWAEQAEYMRYVIENYCGRVSMAIWYPLHNNGWMCSDLVAHGKKTAAYQALKQHLGGG